MRVKRYRAFILALFSLFLILICILQKSRKEEENEFLPSVYFPLKNILSDEAVLNVSASHQIFLIETHMEKERVLDKPRQACAVESAG